MSPFQLIDKFTINGKDKEAELEYADLGELVCIFIRSYFFKSPFKKLILKSIKAVLTPDDNNTEGKAEDLLLANKLSYEISESKK